MAESNLNSNRWTRVSCTAGRFFTIRPPGWPPDPTASTKCATCASESRRYSSTQHCLYAVCTSRIWCLCTCWSVPVMSLHLPPCLLSGWYRFKPNVSFIWTPILRRPVCKYSQNSSYKTYCAILWCFCVPSRLTHYSTLQNPRIWYIVTGTSSMFVEWLVKFNKCYAFLTQWKSNSYILK